MQFCRARHIVDKVTQRLERQGGTAGSALHGDGHNPNDRALVLSFKKGAARLVATDVAARGDPRRRVDCVGTTTYPATPIRHTRSGRTARLGERHRDHVDRNRTRPKRRDAYRSKC